MYHHLFGISAGLRVPVIPGARVSGPFCPWWGLPWQTGPGPPYTESQKRFRVSLARTWDTRAPSWSQAWGRATTASAWWPDLCPRGPAGFSSKRRREKPFVRARHPQVKGGRPDLGARRGAVEPAVSRGVGLSSTLEQPTVRGGGQAGVAFGSPAQCLRVGVWRQASLPPPSGP